MNKELILLKKIKETNNFFDSNITKEEFLSYPILNRKDEVIIGNKYRGAQYSEEKYQDLLKINPYRQNIIFLEEGEHDTTLPLIIPLSKKIESMITYKFWEDREFGILDKETVVIVFKKSTYLFTAVHPYSKNPILQEMWKGLEKELCQQG